MCQPNGAPLAWRKGSKSGYSSDCVEVAAAGRRVFIRDSKDAAGPMLAVSGLQWSAFLAAITAC